MADGEKANTSSTNFKDETDAIIANTIEFLQFKSNKETDVKEEKKSTSKRKRSNEEEITLEDVFLVFLRIIYPLSRCMKKFIVVGLSKTMDCKPVVMINHSGKSIMLNKTAWISLDKRMQLIDCYLTNKIFGKKTSFNLLDSDIEIDVNILRGELYVRLRDVTKHDVKVQLTYEEFSMLHSSSAAINNYINQLHIVESCCKDFLINTIDTLPAFQILYSPLDTSIMNRLPQEVELYRRMKIVNKSSGDMVQLQEDLTDLDGEINEEETEEEEKKNI